MNEQDVRIVNLEPMDVATVWGFGESPENEAWEKLERWASPRGLLDDPEKHPIFGFNNPGPLPDSPRYGYELWIRVGRDLMPEGDVRLADFYGGRYAVMRCEVPDGHYDVIEATWERLVAWCEDNGYRRVPRHCLERSILIPQWPGAQPPPGIAFVMDLYLPITE